MIDKNFIFLAVTLNLSGVAVYALETLRGRTIPNRVTWFLWALAPMVAFVIQIDEGVGLASLMTFAVGFGPAMVFAASFVNPKARWEINAWDYACGGLSLFALAAWLGAHSGAWGVALSIASDALAAIPTARKAISHPETESPWVFFGGAASAVITLLTLEHFGIVDAGFALYILVLCSFLALTIVLGQRRT